MVCFICLVIGIKFLLIFSVKLIFKLCFLKYFFNFGRYFFNFLLFFLIKIV